jgi:hypothetical protein
LLVTSIYSAVLDLSTKKNRVPTNETEGKKS